MQVWKEHKEKASNKENEWSGKLSADRNDGPCQNVTEIGVMEALCSMKAGKAGGANGVTSDLLELCGESVKRLKDMENSL